MEYRIAKSRKISVCFFHMGFFDFGRPGPLSPLPLIVFFSSIIYLFIYFSSISNKQIPNLLLARSTYSWELFFHYCYLHF